MTEPVVLYQYVVELQLFESERYEGNEQRVERAYTAADAVTQALAWGNQGSRRVRVQGVYPYEEGRMWGVKRKR